MQDRSKSSGAQRAAQAASFRLASALAVLLLSSYMLHRFSSTLSRSSSAGCSCSARHGSPGCPWSLLSHKPDAPPLSSSSQKCS